MMQNAATSLVRLTAMIVFAGAPLTPACSSGDVATTANGDGGSSSGAASGADVGVPGVEGGSGSGANTGTGNADADTTVDSTPADGSGGAEVGTVLVDGHADPGITSEAGNGGSDSAPAADASSTRDADASALEGGAAYNPCPVAGSPCVIMPLGDSITNGATATNLAGYRAPLFHLAHAASRSITFVGGSPPSGPAMVDNVTFPRNHEGHSGYNIEPTQGRHGLTEVIPQNITTYRPNIVLLMIGTNDVNTGESMATARLGKFMDSILNADPSLLLVVAQIVPQQMATPDILNMQVQTYNAAIPTLVSDRAAAGKHVRMVDMYTPFVSTPNYSSALMYNTLHPNDAGYSVMAATWYAAIGPLLR